jgi:hypothetical protein
MKNEQEVQERYRSPGTAGNQDAPEPERPLNAQEERGESLHEMEDPPQAEGDRSDVEDRA